MRADNDGGLGVVRIKPLGAGGGGGERSAQCGRSAAVTFSTNPAELTVDGRRFVYPSHVIAPEMDQQALFDHFMPPRIQAFLSGVNVNVMAYGQTGSGKTHTSDSRVRPSNPARYHGRAGPGPPHCPQNELPWSSLATSVFGPPGIMARAAAGELGDSVCEDYGLFPRGLHAIFTEVEQMRRQGTAAVLTGSAVELSIQGNRAIRTC